MWLVGLGLWLLAVAVEYEGIRANKKTKRQKSNVFTAQGDAKKAHKRAWIPLYQETTQTTKISNDSHRCATQKKA
jgi:hypothetical protein